MSGDPPPPPFHPGHLEKGASKAATAAMSATGTAEGQSLGKAKSSGLEPSLEGLSSRPSKSKEGMKRKCSEATGQTPEGEQAKPEDSALAKATKYCK